MLHQPTVEKLLTMRLEPFVEAWRTFEQDANAQQLSFEEKLSLMVDRLWTWRQNLALERRLRYGKLRSNACVEDIDYRAARGLDRNLMRSLVVDSVWVARHEHIFILGPTGVGKSYLACALAHRACRDGYSVLYSRATSLFRDLAIARADGSLRNLLARLGRVDVLIVDDWAMARLTENERRDFWEICEERYQRRSTILTSQVPVPQWHEQIGDPTLADGILDRLVHNAHRIELRGESMRKKRNPPQDEKKG
jgi:DNA replication protein DnaC